MKVTVHVVQTVVEVTTSLGNVKINPMLLITLYVLLAEVWVIFQKIVWVKKLDLGTKVPKLLWMKSTCL